jgi:hypothetical protein
VFTEVSKLIKQDIQDFWQGVAVKQDKLALDGD